MTIEMVYLNPNITTEQADKMVAEVNRTRKRLYSQMFKNAEKLEPEQWNEYIGKCLPFIMWI